MHLRHIFVFDTKNVVGDKSPKKKSKVVESKIQ